MDEHVEPPGAPGMSLDEVGSEALGENRTLAGGVPTSEPPGRQPDPEPAAMGRKVAERASIAAVDRG